MSKGKNDLTIAKEAIDFIAETPKAINDLLQEEFLLLNIPCPVADWILWDTLAECNGWRLQQNEFTRHCRIVDPDNIRRAWGTKNGMKRALEELSKGMPGYRN